MSPQSGFTVFFLRVLYVSCTFGHLYFTTFKIGNSSTIVNEIFFLCFLTDQLVYINFYMFTVQLTS